MMIHFSYCLLFTITFRYEEAEGELMRQFGLVNEGGSTSNLGRVAIELFLLKLAKDDFVAAKKVLHEYGLQYCEEEEVETIIYFILTVLKFFMSLD